MGIILFLNVMVFLFILSIGGCAHAAELERCVQIRKDIRDIMWNDPDAFDIQNFDDYGVPYACAHLESEPVKDWDWIEWGARLEKLCNQHRKECNGQR